MSNTSCESRASPKVSASSLASRSMASGGHASAGDLKVALKSKTMANNSGHGGAFPLDYKAMNWPTSRLMMRPCSFGQASSSLQVAPDRLSQRYCGGDACKQFIASSGLPIIIEANGDMRSRGERAL